MLPWSVSCCIWEPRLRGVEVVSSLYAVAAGVCPHCVLWLRGCVLTMCCGCGGCCRN